MKVKALCNIIRDGKMYKAGDVFEVPKKVPNTVQVNSLGNSDQMNDLGSSDMDSQGISEFSEVLRDKNAKRRRQ